MASSILTSESSESSGGTSTGRPWCRLPRSYLVVLLTNLTATVLLWPHDSPPPPADWISKCHRYGWLDRCEDSRLTCPLHARLFFFGLMLSSVGAGCVAAFLLRRVGASRHMKSACGYALVNWLQAMLGSLGMTNPQNTGPFCENNSRNSSQFCGYGLLPYTYNRTVSSLYVLDFCRVFLYLTGLLWMQMLVLSRLGFLEKSSNQAYSSRCFGRLMWAQVVGAAALAVPAGVAIFFGALAEDRTMFMSLVAVGAIVGVVLLCNWAASAVAISSFSKSFRQLQRICRLAEATEARESAIFALRRARRFSGLQAAGVSFSLIFTCLLVPARFMAVMADAAARCTETDGFRYSLVFFFIQFMDALGNGVAVLLLSGSHRVANTDGMQGIQWPCFKFLEQKLHQYQYPRQPPSDPNWTKKVEELSLRGMTLRSFLQFYREDLPSMPDWKYMPEEHKTKDVVRRVIIPLTSQEECAYAVSLHNRDGPQRAQVMVTHNWGNRFQDLLAAVLSDALQECSFNLAAQLLTEDSDLLQDMLGKMDKLDDTYWICAFAVNQHASICHRNPYDRDPMTNLLHPVCNCNCINTSDPDGRSVQSEINKFDDMMHHLATTGRCRQVIAADQSLDLFHRAWCVAEIFEAKHLQMEQSLKLQSRATIQQRARTLENLDVREMQASSEKDKELILGKIHNIDDFNSKLQVLIFDPTSGLVASWNAMDSLQQTGEVGRLIRWGLADAGSGKVWKAWESNG